MTRQFQTRATHEVTATASFCPPSGTNLTNMLRGEACLFVLLWASQVQPVRAANPCDPGLIQDKSNPYGYRLRGDRCEGIYVQEVSCAPLTIASWTESFDDYNLSSGAALMIEWTTPSSSGVDPSRSWASLVPTWVL